MPCSCSRSDAPCYHASTSVVCEGHRNYNLRLGELLGATEDESRPRDVVLGMQWLMRAFAPELCEVAVYQSAVVRTCVYVLVEGMP